MSPLPAPQSARALVLLTLLHVLGLLAATTVIYVQQVGPPTLLALAVLLLPVLGRDRLLAIAGDDWRARAQITWLAGGNDRMVHMAVTCLVGWELVTLVDSYRPFFDLGAFGAGVWALLCITGGIVACRSIRGLTWLYHGRPVFDTEALG